jgi:hypothetical protein
MPEENLEAVHKLKNYTKYQLTRKKELMNML